MFKLRPLEIKVRDFIESLKETVNIMTATNSKIIYYYYYYYHY